jgi:hypothetical protein
VKVVRRLQPQAVIKQGPFVTPVREDVRWVGNPEAKVPLTNWSVYLPPDQQTENVRIWLPLECDIPMVGNTEEFLKLGQRVSKYKVEAEIDDRWTRIAGGTTIGYRKLDRFPKVTASKVRLIIEEARACPTIKSFGVHVDSVSHPKNFEPAVALSESSRKINRFPATAPDAQHEFEPGGTKTE